MRIDLWTVLFTLSMISLLIERVFYYRSKYKIKKNSKAENPTHGERLATLEEAVKNIKKDIKEIKEKLSKK